MTDRVLTKDEVENLGREWWNVLALKASHRLLAQQMKDLKDALEQQQRLIL